MRVSCAFLIDQAYSDCGPLEQISRADEVSIFIAATTGFRDSVPATACHDTLARAVAEGYSRLEARHVEDYRRLFGRVRLELRPEPGAGVVGPCTGGLSTASRLALHGSTCAWNGSAEATIYDHGLIATFYSYNR
jgi:hypothetical protein